MSRRLGKLAPRIDPRTYGMSVQLAARLPVIPRAVNWARDAVWPMWSNDRIGCCTQVGVASAIRTWTGAAQAPILLSDEQVLANYSAESGYNPADVNSDRGAVILDVLNHWRTPGYNRPGQTRDYLTAYGAIDPMQPQAVQRAIAYLGGVLIGLAIPEWACIAGCGDWSYDMHRDNSSNGGHCVWVHGYDADWMYLNTWGAAQRMSWTFFRAFCDEAYGLVSRENWTEIHGVSPNGEALDALVAELRATV